jgi:hypothetical protein
VVDGLQFLNDNRFGVGDVVEGDGTILETALGHLTVDETIYQFEGEY